MNAAIAEQVELARDVIAKHGYTSPAVITESRLSQRARKTWLGFRFDASLSVGDTVTNEDGSISRVVAVVA